MKMLKLTIRAAPWTAWLIFWLGVLALSVLVGGGAEALLAAAGVPDPVPWIVRLTIAVVIGWMAQGVWRNREVRR